MIPRSPGALTRPKAIVKVPETASSSTAALTERSGCPAYIDGYSPAAGIPARRVISRDGIPIAPALQKGLNQVADDLGMQKLG